MKSSWTGFHSLLAPGIDAFLAHKRALGCLLRVEELSLRLFDRFLIAQPITTPAPWTQRTRPPRRGNRCAIPTSAHSHNS
jgi:hypothetical protein